MQNNPVDGDVQALIRDCRRDIEVLESALYYHTLDPFPSGAKHIRSELARQRIALASLTAEPLAATEKHEISNMQATGLYLRAWPTDRRLNEKEGYTVKLYTTPPAQILRPVELPDEYLSRVLDFAKFVIKCFRKNGEYAPLSSQEPDEISDIISKIEVQRLNATAQPVSDGWVKCSERMPVIESHKWRTDMPVLILCDVGVIPAYYVEVGRADGILYGFKESFRFGDNDGTKPKEDSNGFIKNVTYWMPLPAAPGGQDD